ncbi:MAG: VOC family protein [Deltaproteobacteria bacterium]|nr:VOC family protein [Deltaproteobacteria bacterium]
MTTPNRPKTGRFVWNDCLTTDVKRATAFYTELFNWKVEQFPVGGGTYNMIKLGNEGLGGIEAQKAPGAPSAWLPYLGVENVDAWVKQVTAAKGTVVVAPTLISKEVGRFAVVADPQGAVIAGYESAQGFNYPEPTGMPATGTFCWYELMTTDLDGATEFYKSLTGWGSKDMDMGPMGTYRIVSRGDLDTAGLCKLQPNWGNRAYWLSYVKVDNVDESNTRATKLGATTLVPPTDIPNVGRFAIIADPTGAPIAFFKGQQS